MKNIFTIAILFSVIFGSFQNCSKSSKSGDGENSASSGGSGAWTCYAEASTSMNADGSSPSNISIAWSDDDYDTAGRTVLDKCAGIFSLQMGTEGEGVVLKYCEITHCTHP